MLCSPRCFQANRRVLGFYILQKLGAEVETDRNSSFGCNKTRTKLALSGLAETKTKHYGQFRLKTKPKLVRLPKKNKNVDLKSVNKMLCNSIKVISLSNYHKMIPYVIP